MKRLTEDRGAILVTVLVLTAVVALLGVIAINLATVDIQITGNLKSASTAFEGAEAGADLSIPIIEATLASGSLEPTSFTLGGQTVTPDASLTDEITGLSDYDADTIDVSMDNLGGVAVEVDIDRLYTYTLPGGSMEFAAGYEGVGAGAGGGGTAVLFRIESRGKR